MTLALYLRWRPRRFADLISQEAVARTLRNAVARGTVAHAYLLCGPRGTGKTSIARILYRALNCERSSEGEPCGVCPSCQAVDNGRAMDLIEMDAASHGGVDDVRELRERVFFAPVEAKTKVYIVDEAHQLSPKAWDAFLKTLEEPPPRTVFVLATTEAHKVPATIVSRCQRFDLRRHSQRATLEHLEVVARAEGWEIEAGVGDRLARLARGSLRDALAMLEQLAAFAGTPITMEAARRVLGLVRGDALRAFLDALSQGDARRGLELLEDLTEEGADLRQFLDEVLFYLRAALLVRLGAGTAVEGQMSPEEGEWLRGVAQRWAASHIHSLLRAYGEIDGRGRDEHAVLVRLELVTVWASGLAPAGAVAEEALSSFPRPRGADGEGAAAPMEAHTRVPSESPAPGPRQPGERPSDAPPPITARSSEVGGGVGANLEPEASGSQPPTSDPQPPAPRAVSVAALQARWSALRDAVEGNLLMRLLLQKLAPTALDSGVVTLQGPVDRLELQRLDAPEVRRALEAALVAEFGVPLRVRFHTSEGPPGEMDRAESEATGEDAAGGRRGSIAELGAALFGGQLVEEP